MVARDPIRKVTLSGATKFDDKKDKDGNPTVHGADRYADPHVGSTVNIPEVSEAKATTVSGTASHEVKPAKKG